MKRELDHVLAAAYPADETPSNLGDRIDSQSAGLVRRQVGRRRAARIARGAVAVALLAGAALFGPSALSHASLAGMAIRLDRVESVQITSYTVHEDGSRTVSGRTVFDHGRWRSERGGEVIVVTRDKQVLLDSETGEAVSFPRSFELLGRGFDDLRVSSMIGLSRAGDLKSAVEIDKKAEFRGKRVVLYTVVSSYLPERYRIYADPKTDLPIAGEVDELTNEGWVVRSVYEIEYGGQFDDDLFAPELEPGVSLVSYEESHKAWGKKLAASRLGVHHLRRGELVVRDVQVNALGDVFVLFTHSGRTSRDWVADCLSVTDNSGARYKSVDSWHAASSSPHRRSGWTIGGEPVHGMWFTPIERVPWRPRTVAVSAFLVGDDLSLTESEYALGGDYWQTGEVMEGVVSKVLTQQTYNEPTCGVLPAYRRYISGGVRGSADLEVYHYYAVRRFYWLTENWAALEEAAMRWEVEVARAERQGLGPWSRRDVKRDLEVARRLKKKRPK